MIFRDRVLIKKCFWAEEQTLGIIAVDWSRYGACGRKLKYQRNLVPKCCLFFPNDKRTS